MTFSPQSSYSQEELLRCGEGKLFPTAYPRLPSPPMLMYDRFTQVNLEGGRYGKGEIIGELDITGKKLVFSTVILLMTP